jgi:hypothetical protein
MFNAPGVGPVVVEWHVGKQMKQDGGREIEEN